MATYKVIQDIEAEDKLIGWMSPRQTIYAAIVVVTLFIGFMIATRSAWWLTIPLIPHTILFAVLAGPFVHDQPPEIWLLAKIQFFLKPRKRVWDQSGLKELVTITVPKKIERRLTDGLSQTEVKSRLQALANTIDSRGWAVKNVNVNLYAQPGYASISTDRLIDTAMLPQEVPAYDVTAQDDILDERSNPTAQHLQMMINQSTQTHRQNIMDKMQQPAASVQSTEQPADYWFMNATAGVAPQTPQGYTTFNNSQTVLPGTNPEGYASTSNAPTVTTEEQAALLQQIKSRKERPDSMNSHLRTIQPLGNKKQTKKHTEPQTPVTPPTPSPAVLQLAANDDLNIATIARQANKAVPKTDAGDNEVVISLR